MVTDEKIFSRCLREPPEEQYRKDLAGGGLPESLALINSETELPSRGGGESSPVKT